jgi:hypothetical protein
MTELNPQPSTFNLTIEKGVDLNFARALRETALENGRPVSRPPTVANIRFRMEILRVYEGELLDALDTETGEISVQDAEDAALQFYLPASRTLLLPAGRFVGTFRRFSAGEVTPLGRGEVFVLPGR